MMRTILLGLGFGFGALVLAASSAEAKTVRYELTATQGRVNLSGKKTVDWALMLNGGIPAPTLEFSEGDDAEIVVRNAIPAQELSIHWHGILLPSEMDGVPYVTTPPIRTGESFTFKFRIRQHGTYWYHSHTNVQEQKGLYGAIVIHPKSAALKVDRDVVAVISDWSDENATQILKNLRKDGDYYLYKKNTVRSIFGAIGAGQFGTYVDNEWTRMGGMDYSDVGYDAFLINGKRELQLADARPGERVRVRIVNAAASTYFLVSLGQAPLEVISSDGIDIAPIRAKEVLIGMAETYDLLFTVPDQRNYELRITAQDGTGTASGWIGGGGERVFAPVKSAPDLYAPMSHGSGHAMSGGASEGHGNHAMPEGAHSVHGDHSMHGEASSHVHGAKSSALSVVETLTVDQVRSPVRTAFANGKRVHELKLVLDGDMERYVWHINGKAIHQERTILIDEGDVVRFTFVNQTMMHHPMHLHGHFFRVLNDGGDFSPLKHTVDVSPHATRTIEFLADEPGEWMLHCHNLYHLKTGMARVVKYSTYTPRPEIVKYQQHDPHLHDHWYSYSLLEAASNHAQAYFRLSSTWDQVELRVESRNTAGRNFSFNEEWEFEGDLFYRRWFGRFLSVVGGTTRFHERFGAIAGASLLLPMLVESQLMVDQRGNLRLDLEKRFQWTSRVFTDADITWRPGQGGGEAADLEFEVSLMYSPAWMWAAGFMLTEDAIGVGAQFQF